MNISRISFGNQIPQTPLYDEELQKLFSKQSRQTQNQSYQTQTGYSYTPTTHYQTGCVQNYSHKTQKKIGQGFKKALSYILAAAIGAGAVQARYMTNKTEEEIPQEPRYMTRIVAGSNVNTIQVAQCYDSDARIIVMFNDLLRSNPSAVHEIYVPQIYSTIDSQIEEISSILMGNDHLEPETEQRLERMLIELKTKRQKQQDIATTFTDGKNVYFIIKTLEFSSNPDVSRYGSKMPIEDFCEAFNISLDRLREDGGSPCEIANCGSEFKSLLYLIEHQVSSWGKYKQTVQSGEYFYVPLSAFN